jgi:hypothetical protein
MPAAVQRSIIFPSRQRLTFRIVVRPIEIIDSNRLDAADRFEAGGVVAGRQPRDHALERHLPEQIFRVEVLVGGEFDLTGAVEMAGARPGDRDLAAAEHDAALLAAVTCGAARGIVLALGPRPLHHCVSGRYPGYRRHGAANRIGTARRDAQARVLWLDYRR